MFNPLKGHFRGRLTLAVFFAWLITAPRAEAAEPRRAWTVMIYMNGKNNLEPDALANFYAMASVGSSANVNYVVELGRPQLHHTSAEGNWSGVYRFHVKAGSKPLPAQAVESVGAPGSRQDMGSPEVLRDFVSWAKVNYPAERYMLVIWNHGQGWRFQIANSLLLRRSAAAGTLSAQLQAQLQPEPVLGGYRAVSNDDDFGSVLFNREVQDAVAVNFSTAPLDLIGYDACLMSMMETAYGLSGRTRVMVASEELEPGAGWNYKPWMQALNANPSMGPADLGSRIVQSYAAQYQDSQMTTMSVVTLDGIRNTAATLSTFADAVRAAGHVELGNLVAARGSLRTYGDWDSPPLRTSVDLPTLLQRYEAITSNAALRAQSAAVRSALAQHIYKNYASTRSADPQSRNPYGSQGLAIYFPESRDAFYEDRFRGGYVKQNTDRPVNFVVEQTWPELLVAALGI